MAHGRFRSAWRPLRVFAAISAAFVLLWPALASPANVGAIPIVSLGAGDVTVESETSASHKLVSVEPLRSTESLKTGLGASAVVSLEGVGTVRIGPATETRVTSAANGLTFALAEGALCVQSEANSIAVWVGNVQVTPSSPSAIFDVRGDASSLTLAVFVGNVFVRHAAESSVANAGNAFVIGSDGTGEHQVLLRPTVLTDFGTLNCPDQQVIASAEAATPDNAPSGGHGSGGIIGALLGIAAVAVAFAGHGGGSSSASTTTEPTVPPTGNPSPTPMPTPTPSPTGIPTPTPTPTPFSTPTPTPPPTPTPTPTLFTTPTPTPTPPPPTPMPTPGQLIVSTNTIALVGTGTTATFTASEENYAGTFNAVSSNTTVATVIGSGFGQGQETFTVTAVAPGNANITVSDDHGGQQVIFTSVTTGTMTVNPQTLSFPGLHGHKKFTATDSSATATTVYSATTSDPTVVTVSPVTQTGTGPFKFDVSPTFNTGQATITVSDANGIAVVSVGVGVSPLLRAIVLQPPPKQAVGTVPQPSPRPNPPPTTPRLTLSAAALTIAGPAQSQLFTATEVGYSGPISAIVLGPSPVVIDQPSGPGPTHIFKLTSRTVGSAIIRVSDDHGNSALVSVTVTPGVPALSPSPRPVPTLPPPAPHPPPPMPKPRG